MKYTVYLRTNKVNGKQYVGQTNNFKRREYDWYNINWGYAGHLINNARKKYGVENWDTVILKECSTVDETNYWETFYIKQLNTKYPSGYNLTDGGEGSIGCVFSDERKKNIAVQITERIRLQQRAIGSAPKKRKCQHIYFEPPL